MGMAETITLEGIYNQNKEILTMLSTNISDGADKVENDRLREQLSMLTAELEFLKGEGKQDVVLSPAEQAIQESFLDVIMRELCDAENYGDVETVLKKWIPRYFAYAQDTDKKLAQAMEELHHMRTAGHKTRTESLKTALTLAKLHLTTPAGEATFARDEERKTKFIHALEQLISLNAKRSEVVGDIDAENEGEVAI